MNHQSAILEDEELIRTKAYEIWQSRGGGWGNPNLDWFQAQEKLETEQPQIKMIVKFNPIERSQKMNRYKPLEPVEQAFEQVSDLQKEAYETWMAALPNLPSFSPYDLRGNLKKALSVQQTVLTNSLEFQAQLSRMYVDTQKQFLTNYFNVLKKWW